MNLTKTIKDSYVDQIPDFPQARPINLNDRSFLDSLFARCPPQISEFTFTNLYCWRKSQDIRLSRLEQALIISSNKKNLFYPLSCDEPARLMQKALDTTGDAVFFRVPRQLAAECKKNRYFEVRRDRDHFDYLYKKSDLQDLKGKAFDAKRNFVRRFYAHHKTECRQLKSSDVKDCKALQQEWCQKRICEYNASLLAENEAIIEMLDHFDEFALLGTVLVVDQKIAGFSFGEMLNRDTFVVHAEKADPGLKGAYQAINQCLASKVNANVINREQDLGLANLRKAKMSYHPCGFSQKFSIWKKG